jgi:hypothetical protein
MWELAPNPAALEARRLAEAELGRVRPGGATPVPNRHETNEKPTSPPKRHSNLR